MVEKNPASKKEHSRLYEKRVFFRQFNTALDDLLDIEQDFLHPDLISEDTLLNNYFGQRHRIESSLGTISSSEKLLFSRLFDLFEIKHAIGDGNKILLQELNTSHDGKFIGFIAALGAGKTTIANATTADLNAMVTTKEPYEKNPFWRKSQEHPEYMFRSQVYFFLSNVFSDMRTRLHHGTSVSDTSSLTDILMWADWYHKTGHLTDDEYVTYTKMVELFKPIIPKPDLLVALVPDSVANLKEGIKRRAKNEPIRSGELIFTTPESQELAIQVERVKELIEAVPKEWNIPVLEISVPPLAVFEDPHLSYDYIYRIRQKLGILGEFISPSPETVVHDIIKILAESTERQVIDIHGKSMFSGKTTVLCIVANELGKEKVLAFQPRAAMRSEEQEFAQQEMSVISRDGLTLPARIIENNSLWEIVKYVLEKRVDPMSTPYIMIDEVMLFVAEGQAPEEAVTALERLRQMGFHVIVDGIDYSFQEEPFTFMHAFLKKTRVDKDWHQIEMSTRCRYCNERATGSRRWIIDTDGTKRIADYHDPFNLAGSNMYEPVCCTNHPSCVNQPPDFQRKQPPV